ncbi:hypothetical protein [Bradyrhizobium sp. 21]|uniref:hypothetical protein n=1 Tax=Bradyrhizobium sp. 21 TaxID=2782666 RepID=UPI001FF9C80F|nr:hypothetical protein [Bradyrhizobium sp. 21]MCK1383673.1 hypothetical protein [Bradyrhizobium sp. 21]
MAWAPALGPGHEAAAEFAHLVSSRMLPHLMWSPASLCLIVKGGLQLGQAFAKAQISRATVIDTDSGVADFSFGQL